MAMGVLTVLLLSGSAQLLAVFLQQDGKVYPANLLAGVSLRPGSSHLLVDLSKGKMIADDQQKTVAGRVTTSG